MGGAILHSVPDVWPGHLEPAKLPELEHLDLVQRHATQRDRPQLPDLPVLRLVR